MGVPEYLVPGDTVQERAENKRHWDVVLGDAVRGDYFKLVKMLEKLSRFSLAFKPKTPQDGSRQRDFRDKVDIPFLQQQFEHDLFGLDQFIALFTYWIEWVKPLGAVADEPMLDKLTGEVTKMAREKGYFYVLPYCYHHLYSYLTRIIKTIYELQKRRQDNMKN